MIETYRFGPFELDARTAELRREGEPVPLQLQPARILLLLVERAGELVSREELQALVWPDRVVDYEHGLNYAIRQIRAALGDDADASVYIETLPRRGYRFAAEVERQPRRIEAVRPRRRMLGYPLAALVLTAAVAAAAAAMRSLPPGSATYPRRIRPGSPGRRRAGRAGRESPRPARRPRGGRPVR